MHLWKMANYLPLTAKDKERVKFWLLGMRSAAISGLIAAMLFFSASGMLFWAMLTALQDDRSLPIIILVLALIGIFFLTKAIRFIIKRTNTKKSLTTSQKERISGKLMDVSVKHKRLSYQIDGQFYDVNIVPGHDKRYFGALYRNLFDIISLKQSTVALDLLKVDDGQYLLLDISYDSIIISERMEPTLTSDNIEAKKAIGPLRSVAAIFIFLLLVTVVICFPMFRENNIFENTILVILLSVFLLPAFFVYYKRSRLKQSDQRWVVEGIVTETLKAKERFTRGGGYTTVA